MLDTASAKAEEGRADVDVLKPLVQQADQVQPWQYIIIPVCGLLAVFSVPSMSYGLFKNSLLTVLDLSGEESQDIVSFGLVGGMVLGFVPGLVYDRFGYAMTLAAGGAMAVAGASSWYLQLKDGGAPGSPGYMTLALSQMLMCHGCRWQYFAGMCAVLSTFPRRLASSLSATMAILLSLGYILLPLLWSTAFLPTEPDAFNARTKTLKNLKPVAGFYGSLAAIYSCVTVSGLCIAHWLPKKETQAKSSLNLAGMLQKVKDPDAVALFIFVKCSLAVVYTYMTSGVAATSMHAGATPSDTASVIFRMGLIGMAGRFLMGFGADFMRSKTHARQGGTYLMYLVASLSTLSGFALLIPSPDISFDNWKLACYLIGFGFGGYFALFPASVRTIFGAEQLGFWLGVLFCMIGSLNFFIGHIAAKLEWKANFFMASCCSGTVCSGVFIFMVLKCWGRSQTD